MIPIDSPPLLAEAHRLLYAPLLLVSFSLVYAATRHESAAAIVRRAVTFGGKTLAFLTVFGLLIEGLMWMQ